MATVNEKLADSAISHQIDLLHYENGVTRRIIALLNRVDADLFAQITICLENLPANQFNADRLNSLLLSVRALNREVYNSIQSQLGQELNNLVEYETGYQADLFNATIPSDIVANVSISTVDYGQVYAAALARPFQGRLLKEWIAGIEETRAKRIRDAIRIGYVENQTTSQIIQRIRGTRALNYADGLLDIDRRSAETIIRTALSHTASFAREQFYKVNSDLIKAIVWVSTLDTRTSEICRVRDGLEYTNDNHKPIGHSVPWLSGPGQIHFNCRSSSAPVTKSYRELGLNIDEIKPSSRASMDGEQPADITYNEWLKKQEDKRQNEILGKTRGKLLRDGNMPVEKFANKKGVYYTLDELKQNDAEYFKKAGL